MTAHLRLEETAPARRRISLRGLDREAAIGRLRAWLTEIISDADRAALTQALLFGGDEFDPEQYDAATAGSRAGCAAVIEDAIAWVEACFDETDP